jgi:hypothetical protein
MRLPWSNSAKPSTSAEKEKKSKLRDSSRNPGGDIVHRRRLGEKPFAEF